MHSLNLLSGFNAFNECESDIFSGGAKYELFKALLSLMSGISAPPVILAVGSDRLTGDCLGPLSGHLLTEKYDVNAYVYGTLEKPVVAKNLDACGDFINIVHKESKIIVIDAAMGSAADLGKIKYGKGKIQPGAALNKNISPIGDFYIMGVVSRSHENDALKNAAALAGVSLNIVFKMAETIASALSDAFALNYKSERVNYKY
jgi:putative sporulation protein YyaC